MPNITVVKNSGEKEPFQAEKIKSVVTRLGATEKNADAIISHIQNKYHNQTIRTSDIFTEVFAQLNNETPHIAARLNLKKAILKLGPAGFDFEKYVAAVLRAYGNKAYLPEILQGACISHEVDVVVEKYARRGMIEAKFRHASSIHITIKDTMSTWARFIDLVEGATIGLCPHFDEAWIVTNAKFSHQSLQYGHCKNMVLLGWNHPHERTFAQMIDLKKMYPLTIIEDLPSATYRKLAEKNIMLCSELIQADPKVLQKELNIKQQEMERIIKKCEMVLQ